jgi:GMP synthase (glutamine-hydrolysing)
MPKLLVVQHVPYEILGTLDPLLRQSRFRIRYVNYGRHPDARPDPASYDGIVVLGGPMNVDEVDRYPHLATEIDLIRRALDRRMPLLGICLGAQLIAAALGAPVARSPRKEIGWHDVSPTPDAGDDPLLGHFGEVERVFQWHGDAFDIPESAVRLAASGGCPNQAFRYGSNVYGLQFHLEVDEAMIQRWVLHVPAHRAEIAAMNGAVDPAAILEETKGRIDRLKRLSDRTFRGFVDLFGQRQRHRILPSR